MCLRSTTLYVSSFADFAPVASQGCDDVFIRVFANFDIICPQREDDGRMALQRGKELRRDIEMARELLEGKAMEKLERAGVRVS